MWQYPPLTHCVASRNGERMGGSDDGADDDSAVGKIKKVTTARNGVARYREDAVAHYIGAIQAIGAESADGGIRGGHGRRRDQHRDQREGVTRRHRRRARDGTCWIFSRSRWGFLQDVDRMSHDVTSKIWISTRKYESTFVEFTSPNSHEQTPWSRLSHKYHSRTRFGWLRERRVICDAATGDDRTRRGASL